MRWTGVRARAASYHPPSSLVGFGLGGPEAGVRRADYRDVFAEARAAGLHSLPHAGETVGPQEVWSAVRVLGAERIGHGIAARRDPLLRAHLRERHVVLEVCPLSNVATGAVASLAEHPLPDLLADGVPVVLCSDDPPMFGTSLLEEYRRARDVLGLDRGQLLELAAASLRGGFPPRAPGPASRAPSRGDMRRGPLSRPTSSRSSTRLRRIDEAAAPLRRARPATAGMDGHTTMREEGAPYAS